MTSSFNRYLYGVWRKAYDHVDTSPVDNTFCPYLYIESNVDIKALSNVLTPAPAMTGTCDDWHLR